MIKFPIWNFLDETLWGLNVKKLPWFRIRCMCYGLLSDRLHLIHLSLLTDYIRFAKRPGDILNLKSLRWEMSFDPCDQQNTISMCCILKHESKWFYYEETQCISWTGATFEQQMTGITVYVCVLLFNTYTRVLYHSVLQRPVKN